MEKVYSLYSHLERFVVITNSNHNVKGKEKEKGYVKFTFEPGENFIPANIYNAIKDVPMFQELIALGLKGFEAPEELGEASVLENPDNKNLQAESLRQLPRLKLIDKIKGEGGREGLLDVELLYALRVQDHRPSVLKAVDEQLRGLGADV